MTGKKVKIPVCRKHMEREPEKKSKKEKRKRGAEKR